MPSDKPARGGNLDAKIRAEYDAAVEDAANWNTLDWTTWIVTGRILPERCNVHVVPLDTAGVGAGGRFKARLQITDSLVGAIGQFENGNASIFEIADCIRSGLAFPVDYIAFRNRAAYEIVLDLCINGSTGMAESIPVFDPIFETKAEGVSFEATVGPWEGEIPWAQADVVELPTALHDLTSAIQYPRRTFEYCRMAVEALRRYFDPPEVRKQDDRHRQGLAAMCSALKVTKEALNSLDAVAARSRHGELVMSMDWEKRRRALELGWELVARFIQHLKGEGDPNWKLLDVRIEDYATPK